VRSDDCIKTIAYKTDHYNNVSKLIITRQKWTEWYLKLEAFTKFSLSPTT